MRTRRARMLARVMCAFILTATLGLTAAPRPVLHRDTASRVDIRGFAADKMAGYRQSPDFRYEQSVGPAGFWMRVKNWILRALETLLKAATGTVGGRIVVGLLVILLIAFFASRMAGFQLRSPLGKNNPGAAGAFVTEDDIQDLDFGQAISEAVSGGNLRLAVRLWYLSTLQSLSRKGVIDWRPGKTNHEYLAELAQTRYAPEFDRLTRDFEYCWYGDTQVAREHYDALEQQFTRFNGQITER